MSVLGNFGTLRVVGCLMMQVQVSWGLETKRLLKRSRWTGLLDVWLGLIISASLHLQSPCIQSSVLKFQDP